MLANFGRELEEFRKITEERNREIQQLRKKEERRQQDLAYTADRLSRSIHHQISSLLRGTEAQGSEILNPFKNLELEKKASQEGGETWRYWSLGKDIVLDGADLTTVTIIARGYRSNPTEAEKSFIHIEGAPYFLEASDQHRVAWNVDRDGQTSAFSSRRANAVEARFYRQVLTKFIVAKSQPQ